MHFLLISNPFVLDVKAISSSHCITLHCIQETLWLISVFVLYHTMNCLALLNYRNLIIESSIIEIIHVFLHGPLSRIISVCVIFTCSELLVFLDLSDICFARTCQALLSNPSAIETGLYVKHVIISKRLHVLPDGWDQAIWIFFQKIHWLLSNSLLSGGNTCFGACLTGERSSSSPATDAWRLIHVLSPLVPCWGFLCASSSCSKVHHW